MRCELAFHPAAWWEWQARDGSVRTSPKRGLAERLQQPRVPAGHPDRYKIKLRSAGCRLVYEVQDAPKWWSS